ncbi:MHS family MFS transporter [Rhodococcus opacus]|nr:MHS family MFS transporter [Rhodococcus opacus]
MLEYYDFVVYGAAAALVFPALFFPSGTSGLGVVAALATFGVGYIARPLGGIVLGHFGDRVGRKKVLLFTLVLMGVSSMGIGFLPTYEQVGLLAPVLLVVARLAQGFSAGGEAAGASTLTLEHSPVGKRGLFTSFTMSGCQAGTLLATLVFIPIASMPDDMLMAWGWRIPFWSSLAVIVLAYVVRSRLDETPVFEAEVSDDDVPKMPIVELFRTQWADVLRVVFASIFAIFQTIVTVFGVAYATSDEVGIDRAAILWVTVIANVVAVVMIPIAAMLSDRIGRRPVWMTSAILCAALVFVYFWAVSTGRLPLIYLVGALLLGVVYSGVNALWPAYFSELFAAPVRYSGFAIGSQVGFLLAGFAPSIGYLIMSDGVNGWIPVAVFAAVCGVVSALAVFTARETHDVPLDRLGKPRSVG